MSSERLAGIIPFLPDPWITAGGGAANTARAAHLLGLDSSFVGAVGNDSMGSRYRADLETAGLEVFLSLSKRPTGIFCAIINPDGGRTILVAPGAAPDVALSMPVFQRNKGSLLYMDGFLASNSDFFAAEARKAKNAGMLVAIDLGSRGFVEGMRDFLLEAIPSYCDFVFANEDEFIALVGGSISGGLALLGKGECGLIIKRAEKGALFARRGSIWESPVRAQKPLDETGAGDAFAAGFLAGLSRGFAPSRALRLGNRIAEEVLAVPGMRLDGSKIRSAAQSVAI
ncbi:MAG: carbohydrate kinase family protein [Spirochaetota bacterium]